MPRQVQITLPADETEGVVSSLENISGVHGLAVFEGKRGSDLIIFRTTDKETDRILAALERLGVGVHYGVIDILALQSTRPQLRSTSKRKKFLGRRYKFQDRLSIEEIHDVVDSQNHLTFNFLSFIFVAALIATVGLATDSAPTVVASMLVSPLMGPIMAVTFGTAIRDAGMVLRGFRNEVCGFLLTMAVGAVWGLATSWKDDLWGTEQQLSRGDLSAIIYGIFVAVPSGLGVAVATTGGGISALVGVAISAALLPPICNCGMHLAYGLVKLWAGETRYAMEMLKVGGYSCLLFLVNFIFIFVMALVMFWIKRVAPRHRHDRTPNSLDDGQSHLVPPHAFMVPRSPRNLRRVDLTASRGAMSSGEDTPLSASLEQPLLQEEQFI
ncbi:DUF389 domain-containing protein [Balamuthia mandrillaris]